MLGSENMEDESNHYCVYMHISPSGKKYIGITKQNPQKRWQNGYGYLNKNTDGTFKQPYMARAVLKYTNWNDDWKHLILMKDITETQAKEAEIMLIKEYKTCDTNYGYNITSGGDGMHNWAPSDETKQKISNTLKGKMSGENHPMYGKHHSNESKQKMADKSNERWRDATEREKASEIAKHRFENAAEREKISKARIDKNIAKGFQNPRAKCVYCIELQRIFWGAKEAHDVLHVDQSAIAACCRKKYGFKSAGKHPDTCVPLHWLYADDAVAERYITQEQLDIFRDNLVKGRDISVQQST
jgi:group I intron endonuclease